MSKAEERARDLGYGTDPLNRAEYTANEVRDACIDGYQQAEEDLQLTWEDVKQICDIAFEEACRLQRNMKSSFIYKEQHYQEVLKRFKDLKEKKEK